MPCSVDITLLKLLNLSWILSASFCACSSETSSLLAVDFASFVTSVVLLTSVLQCFLKAFGLFRRLISFSQAIDFKMMKL